MPDLVFAVLILSGLVCCKDDQLYSQRWFRQQKNWLAYLTIFRHFYVKNQFPLMSLFSSFNQPSINFLQKHKDNQTTPFLPQFLAFFPTSSCSPLFPLPDHSPEPALSFRRSVLLDFCESHHFNLLIIIMLKKSKAVQIIKGRLHWISDSEAPKNIPKSFYFNIDNDLIYDSFNEDFGPLNLGKTWKYVTELEKLLAHPEYKTNQIYHFTGTQPDKAANSAYLICAFQIISLGYSAKKAHEPFKNITFRPFRDAGYAECTYKCTLLDCLGGLEYAIKLGWFNYKTFNLAEYEHYERIENGDLNWIIPQKFIAFSSPSDKTVDKHGNRTFTPQDYAPIFKKLGAKAVVRLNNKTYEANDFVKNGIGHHQLYFPDGSVPSMEIVTKFLQLAEETHGAIAIHCKAGLGRTGTLIACYAMKHYHFPAAEFIGWIRIARPGSILGPQQNYLIEIEKTMRQLGANSPIWKEVKEVIDEKELSHHMKNMSMNEMSKRQVEIMHNGEAGQGEGLVSAKLKKESASKVTSSYREKSNSKSSSSGKYSPHSSVSPALSRTRDDLNDFQAFNSRVGSVEAMHEKSDPALDVGQFLDVAFGDVDHYCSSFGLLAALARHLLRFVVLQIPKRRTFQPQQVEQI